MRKEYQKYIIFALRLLLIINNYDPVNMGCFVQNIILQRDESCQVLLLYF